MNKIAKNLGFRLEERTEEQKALAVRDFILKLAGDNSWNRVETVKSIVNQLEQISKNSYFPNVFNSIDPDQFSSETKLLANCEKDILRKAITAYVRRYGC